MAVDEWLEVSDKFTLIIICVMSFCKVFLTNPMLDDSLCNLDDWFWFSKWIGDKF